MPPAGVRKGTKRARSEARRLGIEGRSKMNKAQLERAVDRKK